MNQNAQASRQRIAGMLARFLGNSAMFDCSPAKAVLPGAEAPSTPLCSGEGILAGAGTILGAHLRPEALQPEISASGNVALLRSTTFRQ